jgi:putative membrane protein
MKTVVLEARRKPPFLVRVVASGAINLLGLWFAGALHLVTYNNDFLVLLLAAVVLAAINIVIRPLMMLLSIPFIIATLGFFMLVVNALMLWITDELVPNFGLIGFWRTIGAAIILGIANLLLGGAMRDFTERPQRETHEFD